jgi:hypothetical protein
MTWETKVVRLEFGSPSDVAERVLKASDACKADGWNPVGVVTSSATRGLYLLCERPVEEAE